ncbi:MAG: VCBS repeat-containing protein [Acidobacteriota bacterium]
MTAQYLLFRPSFARSRLRLLHLSIAASLLLVSTVAWGEGSLDHGGAHHFGSATEHLDVVPLWTWDAATRSPDFPRTATTPVAAQLTDDDENGVIDSRDRLDLVFCTWGSAPPGERFAQGQLHVIDGETGELHWSLSDPVFGASKVWRGANHRPMVLDIDGDDVVEILVATLEDVVALDHDGSFLWRRPWPEPISDQGFGQSWQAADLDLDGVSEIIDLAVVVSVDGSLQWAAPQPGYDIHRSAATLVADLVPSSPGRELLLGNVAYSAQGSPVWQAASSYGTEGANDVGDLDGDGLLDVVNVQVGDTRQPGVVRVVSSAGEELVVMELPTALLPDLLQYPSGPTLGDLDLDGELEVVIPANDRLRVFDHVVTDDLTGELLPAWDASIQDVASARATVADVDQDGSFELLHGDETHRRIFSGSGELLFEEAHPAPSYTGCERPTVIPGECGSWVLFAGWDNGAASSADSLGSYAIGCPCTTDGPPEPAGAILRLRKSATQVTAHWDSSRRPLSTNETYRLHRATVPERGGWPVVHDDVGSEHSEPPSEAVGLWFYDLRVADCADVVSED